MECAVAVISVLPPAKRRQGRYLLTRLRKRLADLPVVIGAWNNSKDTLSFDQLGKTRATYVTESLSDALARICSLVNCGQAV
mgnify:CR=1 FL=1